MLQASKKLAAWGSGLMGKRNQNEEEVEVVSTASVMAKAWSYQCMHCSKMTMVCWTCKTAFAFSGHSHCILCSGGIKEWPAKYTPSDASDDSDPDSDEEASFTSEPLKNRPPQHDKPVALSTSTFTQSSEVTVAVAATPVVDKIGMPPQSAVAPQSAGGTRSASSSISSTGHTASPMQAAHPSAETLLPPRDTSTRRGYHVGTFHGEGPKDKEDGRVAVVCTDGVEFERQVKEVEALRKQIQGLRNTVRVFRDRDKEAPAVFNAVAAYTAFKAKEFEHVEMVRLMEAHNADELERLSEAGKALQEDYKIIKTSRDMVQSEMLLLAKEKAVWEKDVNQDCIRLKEQHQEERAKLQVQFQVERARAAKAEKALLLHEQRAAQLEGEVEQLKKGMPLSMGDLEHLSTRQNTGVLQTEPPPYFEFPSSPAPSIGADAQADNGESMWSSLERTRAATSTSVFQIFQHVSQNVSDKLGDMPTLDLPQLTPRDDFSPTFDGSSLWSGVTEESHSEDEHEHLENNISEDVDFHSVQDIGADKLWQASWMPRSARLPADDPFIMLPASHK
ncbi:hypothetical protein CYMTET_18141 [Cymbomonas tetramitiformis]|uniref:Uncharacterized protein n=1 Tax=Cymbomonas tetramitiformis TaxID=36881 RepID=A0AAE0G952_9CHLO|nr:hypothetical protein CYMTET_18141 [Cymbomonas tetramitiformis]